MIQPDYWAAAATVMPVLATALVIETRELARRWGDNYPIVLMALQYLAAGFPILLMFLAELRCFEALRGVSVAPIWISIIEMGITWALGTLVGAPALLFLVMSIGSISYFLTRIVPKKITARLLRRRLAQLQAKHRRESWNARTAFTKMERELLIMGREVSRSITKVTAKLSDARTGGDDAQIVEISAELDRQAKLKESITDTLEEVRSDLREIEESQRKSHTTTTG